MAIDYQLVTTVSGAVVLENKSQYKESDLTPVDEQSVPTIPEPETWLLIILSIIMLALYLFYSNRKKLQLKNI